MFDLRDAATSSWRAADTLGLRFRGSDLARSPGRARRPQLHLAPGDVGRRSSEIAEIVRWRRENQPGGQNAGSVFVNPIPASSPRAS